MPGRQPQEMLKGSWPGTWLLTTWPKSISSFSIISSGCISKWYTDGCDIFKTLLVKFCLKTYTLIAGAVGSDNWDREGRVR